MRSSSLTVQAAPYPTQTYATTRPSRFPRCIWLTSPTQPPVSRTVECSTAIDDYLEEDVLPYVPDAWPDLSKTKIGYEIPLTRYFYTYTPPRPLHEIDAEINSLEAEIKGLLAQVTK